MSKLKILFIGGTGNISLSVSKLLLQQGHDLYLLNRSGPHPELSAAKTIQGDINSASIAQQLADQNWDVVVNWIAFTATDAQRDIELFAGKTQQYVFISSASCYQNPGPTSVITERTPLENPFWLYSRDKIAAEVRLMNAHADSGFPAVVVRPSLTYSSVIPLTIGGWTEYNAVTRMKQERPVVVQGDGTSMWTVTHSEDFARGFIGLLGKSEATGEDFHITTDEFLSWNEIYQLTAAAVGKSADIVHVTSDKICELDPEYTGTLLGDKSVSAIFDNSKIKQLVPNFKAELSYQEGIKKAVAWFEQDTSRQFINPETEQFIDKLVKFARG